MKKTVCLIVVLSMVLIINAMWVFAESSNATDSTDMSDSNIILSTIVDGVEIKAIEAGPYNYLLLPPTADLTQLNLNFWKDGEVVTDLELWGRRGYTVLSQSVDITSISKMDGGYKYAIEAFFADDTQYSFYIMQAENIPTIYLTSDDVTKDREWVDSSKKNKTSMHVKFIAADGNIIYDDEIKEIKARGNSTFTYSPKKSYQIKLNEKTDMLGIGEKEKTWVLLANYGDATLMHDKVMKDLASDIGLDYVTDCNWVNLYYDGEYRGVYTIGEKNSIGSTGVDVTDMEKAYEAINSNYGDNMETSQGVNSYGLDYLYTINIEEIDDVTGGYLIEKNLNFVDEASGFYTARGMGFNVKSPEYAGQEAMEYISEYYQAFEDAVYATDEYGNYTGYNEETGKFYYEYVDKTSLVKTFLLQEFAINPDGFDSSLYFYKDVNDIMYCGPIWDQDNTLGTGWNIYISPWVEDYHYLAEALVNIPDFNTAVKEYYTTTFAAEIEELFTDGGILDMHKETLDVNAAMNYKIWPYIRISNPNVAGHIWGNPVSYDIVTADMKSWCKERLDVLNQRFATNSITRAHFISMIAEVDGQDVAAEKGQEIYQKAIEWAVAAGISDGTSLYDPITREQAATMLYRYEGERETNGSLTQFVDGKDVSSWAEAAMKWAVEEGIFKGYGSGVLKPRGLATYKEAITILDNYSKFN